MSRPTGIPWWQKAVFYHIYPQSFLDTNSDGIGDLEGIRRKLSYLKELGVDAIWLSPVYMSPLKDEGYDVSGYTTIHPRYGTMEDFLKLLSEAHALGLRLIMDLVLNHTSDMHPWFTEARSSADHPRHDWYLWHAGRNGKKPNNWLTNFGRSAWKKEEATGKYYYHSFFPEQPDLNWRNPQVKKAMFNIVRYWLGMGVDGFRLDVANMLFKHKDYPDNPVWALVSDRNVYNRNQPETYQVLRDLRSLVDHYPGRITIGEVYVSPPGNSALAASFLGNGEDMLHLAFDFTLLFTRWSAFAFRNVIRRYYKVLPADGWPCFVLSNHDLGRAVNHYLFPLSKEKKARLLATLLLTLRGTPFIYYGDEIGMENRHIPRSRIRDRYGRMLYPLYKGRDKARTPMQWEPSWHAGFSPATPWLPVHRNYRSCNVATQRQQADSVWNHYHSLLRLRRTLPALQTGEIEMKRPGNGYLMYTRRDAISRYDILLNFTPFRRKVTEYRKEEDRVILHSTHPSRTGQPVQYPFYLLPYEGVIIGNGFVEL